jgi:uncharacterized protein
MHDATRARALAYVQAHHVVTLATHGAGGAWAAAVFYANEGFTLYWLSAPASRHSVNLARTPRIAASIQEDYSDWPDIKGLQLEGDACEIGGDEAQRARELYGARYAVVRNLARAPASIVAAMAKVRWYRFVPERVYFIDNSVAFGHREEILNPGQTQQQAR